MMSGMLVAVEDLIEPVGKAARAVETLFGIDPDFVTLCKTLYGPDVDPAEVWWDVFSKENPTGPDMMTPSSPSRKKRALEAAGIGATVIGLGLGAKEGKASLKEVRAAGGWRSKGGLWPKAKVAGITAMGGGDAAATVNQISSARQKRRGAVNKLAIPGVHEMAEGLVTGMKKLPGIGGLAPKVQGAATTAGAKVQGAATAKPKTALGIGAGTAGATGNMIGRRQQKQKDATTLSKRDEDIDVVWAGEFSKFDEDKRLVFGWASVVELNGSPVVDRQGDYIHPDDLENASYDYVIKSRVGGDMHARTGEMPMKVSDLVESMVFTPEKVEKMGLPAETAAKIPTGWWVGFKVHSDRHWDLVKKGERAGFSIHGRGKRVPTSVDDLMGY